jgi:hypothetical protein
MRPLSACLNELDYTCNTRNGSEIEEDHSLVYLRYLRNIHDKINDIQDKINDIQKKVEPQAQTNTPLPFNYMESYMFR